MILNHTFMKRTLCLTILFLGLFASSQNKPKNGLFKDYHSNGELKTVGYYKNDKKVAHWKYYWDNGQLKKETTFEQTGDWTGYGRRYSKDGILLGETKPNADKSITERHYFSDGTLKREFILLPFGEKKHYLKHGNYKEFLKNNSIKIYCTYNKGELSGLWKQYYNSGEKQWEVNYVNGYKHGTYKRFHKNGKLYVKGQHENGRKTGEEMFFDPDGNQIGKLKFKKGILKRSSSPIVKPISVPDGVLEKVPIYPGCENNIGNRAKKDCMAKEITNFVISRFNTTFAKDTNLRGSQKIYVLFKINETGEVVDIKARAKHKAFEAEATRVIALLPKMTPGTQYGKPIKVPYSLPIIFKI